MSQTFQRVIEDFTCEHCGYFVTGNGYTNHCSECLWSKHVDVYPGDRQETCGGMMQPMNFTLRRSKYMVMQRCTCCGFEYRNSLSPQDRIETLTDISRKQTTGEVL